MHKLGVKKSIGPLEKSAALEKVCIRYVQMIHPPFKSSREMIQLQNNKMVKQKEEEKSRTELLSVLHCATLKTIFHSMRR